jgi:hypothetical protein
LSPVTAAVTSRRSSGAFCRDQLSRAAPCGASAGLFVPKQLERWVVRAATALVWVDLSGGLQECPPLQPAIVTRRVTLSWVHYQPGTGPSDPSDEQFTGQAWSQSVPGYSSDTFCVSSIGHTGGTATYKQGLVNTPESITPRAPCIRVSLHGAHRPAMSAHALSSAQPITTEFRMLKCGLGDRSPCTSRHGCGRRILLGRSNMHYSYRNTTRHRETDRC